MQHPLKEPWFLSFLPNITPQLVAEYGNDWNVARQKLQRSVDFVRTIEELWSTFNSLPKISSLSPGDTVILARDNKDPSFEAFPEGRRVVLTVMSAPAAEKAIDIVLAAVVGEQLTVECDGESTCDVIRLAHKPSYQAKDCVRIEVWLRSGKFVSQVMEYLKTQLKDKNVTNIDLRESALQQ